MADDSKRFTGFKPAKTGRIHLRCHVCGRKLSNVPRESTDPVNAFLVEAECDRHPERASLEPPSHYFNATGEELDWETGEPLTSEASHG